MIFKFFPKLLYERHGGHRRRISKWAKRLTQHVLRQVINIVDVFFYTAARMKPRQGFFQPVRAFAAWNAPAAAFMLVELHSAKSAMQVVSSRTTTPPDPSIEPVFATESKSMATSISSGNSTGVDDPPGTTAFKLRPLGIPPPTS